MKPLFSISSLVVSLLATAVLAGAEEVEEPLVAMMPDEHFDILDTYCLSCHDSLSEEGEVNLEELSFDLTLDIETAETWQKVLNSMNSGEMPPEDKKQLKPEEKTAFLSALSEQMVLARNIMSDSGGEIALRRLNRREYANTLEDLLGVRPDTSLLPDDQANAEFDTLGASLFFSSDQLEQYLATARKTLELSILAKAPPAKKTVRFEPEEHWYPIYADLAVTRLETAQRYYNWRKAGGTDEVAKEFGFLDGWQAGRQIQNFRESYLPLEKWLLAPENKTGGALMITIKTGFTQSLLPRLREWESGRYIIRVRAGAYEDDPVRFRYLEFARKEGQNTTRLGWRKVTSSLENPEVIEFEIEHEAGMDASYVVQKRSHMDRGDKNLEAVYRKDNGHGTPWGIWIDWAEMEGPLPEEPNEAVGEIFFERSEGQSEDEYARAVLKRFATKAFRGEVPAGEYLDKVFARYTDVRAKNPEMEMKEALVAPMSLVLSSPSFLYMVEAAGNEKSEELTGVELATRLSYFLWSASPDEELLELGQQGKLKKPWVLKKQTARMLNDPRSERFVRSFVYQWLEMHRLGMFAFEGRDFPTFDNAARDAAGEEVYQTFMTLLKEDLPLQHLLNSDFLVLNDLMADYYGIEGVKGDHWRKVPVPEVSPRGGLMASAAIAAMGSDGQRSSPVERGAWVLRKLMNNPPPPAPPNVPMLERFDGELISNRELGNLHAEEPQCANCHRKIDPIGFGMENFDASGKWREVEKVAMSDKALRAGNYETFDIDPSGSLIGGIDFKDFFELRDIVADNLDGFASGMAESMVVYGLGRPFGFSDHLLVEEILEKAKAEDYVIDAFIHALVQSKSFKSK